MISIRDKQKVVSTLNSVLGASSKGKDDNHKFHCPFCNHRKRKLEIDISSQDWHCWVCDAKGRTIPGLFKRLNVSNSRTKEVYEIYKDENGKSSYFENNSDEEPELTLPPEYRPLHIKPSGMLNIDYNNAIHYLKSRGIGQGLIKKYNIGYCSYGTYGGYLIIPSYSDSGQLNYFISRTYNDNNPYKYKNPPTSRDVIVFEDQINWNLPITLVEGAFDAISIRRNSIPILGKVIPRKLMDRIFIENVTHINMMLDKDAYEQSLKYTNYFTQNGIQVTNIIPKDDKDAADLGFEHVTKLIKSSKETKWDDIIFSKLNNL